jgi:hypothetical protein
LKRNALAAVSSLGTICGRLLREKRCAADCRLIDMLQDVDIAV